MPNTSARDRKSDTSRVAAAGRIRHERRTKRQIEEFGETDAERLTWDRLAD